MNAVNDIKIFRTVDIPRMLWRQRQVLNDVDGKPSLYKVTFSIICLSVYYYT